MDKKLNVAVIGIGSMGKMHARVYSEIEQAKLVAVCDIDEKTGQYIAAQYHCKYYKDYKEMLKNEQLDAISLVVPTKFHHSIAKDIINAKVNILIEKPIAATVDEAKDIINLAKKNEIKLMIGHIERFNPAVQELKRLIAAGELGEISSISAKRVGLFPLRIKDANVVIDAGVHDIDIFNYLLDSKPTKISSNVAKAVASHEKEDYANIFVQYGKINAFLEVNWITPVKIRRLSVTGTKGYAELDYMEQTLVLYKNQENLFEKYAQMGALTYADYGVENIVSEVKVGILKKEPLKLELSHFLNCVINNKKPLVSGEEGLLALSIALESIKKSRE